ncbi:MAG: Replication initiation and membrane attachment [Firmicutes bacterium ADurb.Bin248]|nr:MAG: Replication initiation and membrane attachment [Firmicutes bacterium ADurb.Bin248]HOG01938.1 DnaD domain protein [Clostridia bacterium]
MPAFIRGSSLKGMTVVENSFITDYMPGADGTFVKVYLYGLMRCFEPASDAACPFDGDTLARAYAYWQSLGLVRVATAEPLAVEYLGVGEKASDAPRKYASLVEALAKAAGTRVFTGHELAEIYDWIETFRFEEETAVLCVTDCLVRHGARAKLWQMNAEAKLWADNGVFTAEDARAFIAKRDARNRGAQAVLSRWKKHRPATEDELALYVKWTDEWGFDESVILDACQELTAAGQPSFKYLDAVLDTYRINGALTPEAAAEARRARDATAELARLVLERAGINRAPSAAQKDDVSLWRNGWHMDPELLLLAADASNGLAQPYANIKKLLASWHGANISTLAAAGADLEKKGQAAERRDAVRRSRALGHSQRKYSDEELKRIGIDLLDN